MTYRMVMIALFVLVVCCALLGVAIWLVFVMTERRYRSFRERRIPHTSQSVLTQFLKHHLFKKESYSDKTLFLYKRFEKKKYVGFNALNANHILIKDFAMIKSILIDDFSYFQDRTTYAIASTEKSKFPFWGRIFTLSADDWKIMRHLLSSYLTSKPFLKKCFQQCVRASEELCAGIDRLAEVDPEIDAVQLVARYAASTTAHCVLGGDLKRATSCGLSELGGALVSGLAAMLSSSVSAPRSHAEFHRDYRWVDSIERRLRAQDGGATNDLLGFLCQYRNRHVTYHKPTNSIVLSEHLVKERPEDWLPTVHVTDDAIVSQAYVACLAGFEGSRSVVASALLEIARQPDVQDRIVEEIEDSAARSGGGGVAYEQLLEMEYLDMVLNEVLRLHPPVGAIARRCLDDYRFEGDQLRLARGDSVAVSVLGLHTDPRLWNAPLKFDPERFNPDVKRARRHPCAFMPFGSGPRHCIGIRFAKLQCLTALFHLLRRFRVEAVGGVGGGEWQTTPDLWEQPSHCRVRFYRRGREE